MPDSPPIIAVIDDDESMCKALQRLLTASGFAVRSYFSAEAFLDDLNASVLKFLVVDVGLPGMSGLELVAHLRSQRPPAPPVAFISAHDDDEVRHDAERLGCVTFLKKPFLAQALIAAMQQATDAD